MRSRTLILGGLALCLGVFTWPAWRTLVAAPPAPPDLVRPVNATRCVAPTAYMRSSHMILLRQWREAVVRTGTRTYTSTDGQVVRMSLTGTCLRACHTDKSKFCDRCHDYADVKPTCWNCHVADAAPVARSVSPVPRAEGLKPLGYSSLRPEAASAVLAPAPVARSVSPVPRADGLKPLGYSSLRLGADSPVLAPAPVARGFSPVPMAVRRLP